MSDAVVVALITVTANVILQIVSAAVQSKDLLEKLQAESELADERIKSEIKANNALIYEKIDELSRRVEKHNSVIDRTYKLEETVARHDEKIKTLFSK
jgi:hypothetical protein